MNNASWIVYGILMALLQTTGAVVALSNGAPGPVIGFGALMMMIYLTGLYGYVAEVPLRTRRTWKVVPFFVAAGLVFEVLRSIRGDGLLLSVGPVLLYLPLFYALFRYGYHSDHIWECGSVSESTSRQKA